MLSEGAALPWPLVELLVVPQTARRAVGGANPLQVWAATVLLGKGHPRCPDPARVALQKARPH